MTIVDNIIDLYERRGGSEYGGEAVTQLEHALQCAALAEAEGASLELIVAALLHDVGHLLHALPDDAPDIGTDDHHESSGYNFLRDDFPDAVLQPIRLHVAAKRYLCAVDKAYLAKLSQPSITSLALQGGPMSDAEAAAFGDHPHCEAAVLLRRWDDIGKVPDLVTPPLSHFVPVLNEVAKPNS